MFRQSPSRNHRSKGIKTKRVLQICVLLAICFWLIYQVKHSHDKKKALDESDAKIPFKSHVSDEIIKFGRKDLHPLLEETIMKNEKRDEEVEEEETGGGEEEEDEDNKHEEEEQEEDSKIEEKEDEGRGGGGDDEIDEHDQEKSEMEVEREDDFLDEEKEREVGDEEAEGIDPGDKEGQNENETSSDGRDRDGGSRNDHEAREEQYRADDASSAVTHETEGGISTENERGSLESSNEDIEMKIREEEIKVNNGVETAVGQNSTGLKAGEGELADTGILPTVGGKEEEGHEILSLKSDESSVLNSTMTTKFNNQPELGNNSTEGHLETTKISLQNGTEAQNATVGSTTSENILYPDSKNNTSDSNLKISGNTENVEAAATSSNSSTTSELAASEKVITSNESVEVEGGSGSSMTDKNTDSTQNEKSDTSNGADKTDERSDSLSKTEKADEVLHDPIDSSESSMPLEEKDVRTDLDTLPEIRTKGSNNEGAAAE